MTELRWNPILNQWVIFAGHRAKRPLVHKKSEIIDKKCPFCPGGEEVEGEWKVKYLPNRFPSLQINPPDPDVVGNEFMPVKPAKGVCEVIVYTKDHLKTIDQLPIDHIIEIVKVWCNRYEEIGKIKDIQYVFIFENTGLDIGVSLDHPHGQLYSFPYIPPLVERELKSAEQYYQDNKACLFCDLIKFERAEETRVIFENEDFICFVPFFAPYPYSTHIYPKRHLQCLLDFNAREQKNFAESLKKILRKYRKLFPDKLDYIMIFHQRPTTDADYPFYHFYVEFIILQRGGGQKKYLGGVERGTGTIINDSIPEDRAKELRSI